MTKRRIVWDAAKAQTNMQKHGVTFDLAARVFLDPMRQSKQDRIEGGEERWQTVGQVNGMTLLRGAHTIVEERPDQSLVEVIRIISARRAVRSERKRFENGEL
jgi:uncharacterized protein